MIKLRWSLPRDPEDKFGPTGFDPAGTPEGNEQRYIAAGQTIDYRVEIWNHEDAEVAAQDVMIEDTLDPNVFDLSTFEFTRVGLLRWDVPLPGGQAIDTRIDMRPDMNLVVDVTATFDPETGKIDWWFHCMDPLTGEYPEDPLAGILPPFNPDTGYELGWVEFRVRPKDDLPSGTRIENRAYGEFDFMGDRYNNPAPPDGPWVNTIDAGIPEDASHVEPLPAATTQTSFDVNWTGYDDVGGSGIAHYDIYVSDNGGSYTLWLDNTTETSQTFSGQADHNYAFYSVATDNVGHQEPAPLTLPDAQITTGVSATASIAPVIRAANAQLPADPKGEATTLPESVEWIDEWTPIWVEIWVSTVGTDDVGLESFSVELTYSTTFLSTTIDDIEAGPAFSGGSGTLTGSVDDATGVVEIGGTTVLTDVGDDQYVLLARILFQPTTTDAGVTLAADGKYITPVANGFGLEDAEVTLVGNAPAVVELGDPPDTELWPVMYDLDNMGLIDFGDFTFFATNFAVGKTDSIEIQYTGNFPVAWRPTPLSLEASLALPEGPAAVLTEEKLDPIVAEVAHRLETSAGSEAVALLENVSFEIVDLPGNLLGQSLDARVWIDVDAAGFGWFIDATPWDSVEFSVSTDIDELMATLDSPARGRVDLLTTLMHELGHVLGHEHSDGSGLMNALLPVSTRRPFDDDVLFGMGEWLDADHWDEAGDS